MKTVPLVVGNWKMNGSAERLRDFALGLRHGSMPCEAVLCVPATLLASAQRVLGATPLRWGAQDCAGHDCAAATGDVSAEMIGALGARYVIVGHSERRARHGESDALVAEKAGRVLAAGMTPIVCIGETAAERDANLAQVVMKRQLKALARALPGQLNRVVLAYEPLWAIGSGDAATPGTIAETMAGLATTLHFEAGQAPASVRILYGGSVNSRNAAAILSCSRVDGLLVGGASLDAMDFAAICRAAGRCADEGTVLAGSAGGC
jgi:triosephosphate isomerase